MLSTEQLKEFGERGSLVVPGAVAPELVARANRRVDELIAAEPQAEGHVGAHFYFKKAAEEPALIGPLTDAASNGTAAFGYAEALVRIFNGER